MSTKFSRTPIILHIDTHYKLKLLERQVYRISRYNKDISRDMGSAAEGQDSRAPACQDSTQ